MIDLEIAFWLILMIILDALAAFWIPASRVKKKLLDLTTRKTIIKKYITGKSGIYEKLRPRLQEDAKQLVDSISQRFTNEMDIKINNIVTNDIPHIIDERIDKLDQDFGNAIKLVLEQLNKVSSDCMRVVGAKGNIDKSLKEQKRLIAERAILEQKPKFGGIHLDKMLNLARQGRAFGIITKGEYNHYLDQMIKMYEGNFDGSETFGGLPLLSESLPLHHEGTQGMQEALRQGAGTQKEGTQVVMQDIDIDEATAEQLIRDSFDEIGFPKEKVDQAIKRNKEIRKKKRRDNDEKEEKVETT